MIPRFFIAITYGDAAAVPLPPLLPARMSTRVFVIVRYHNTAAKGSNDEEDAESPVDGLEGCFDVDARTFGFSGHHGHVFGPDDRERGGPKTGQETFESTQAASAEILCKAAGVVPVWDFVSLVFMEGKLTVKKARLML